MSLLKNTMDRKKKRDFSFLDSEPDFLAGPLTAFPNPNQPKMNVRAVYDYALEQGKPLEELTDKEIQKFVILK